MDAFSQSQTDLFHQVSSCFCEMLSLTRVRRSKRRQLCGGRGHSKTAPHLVQLCPSKLG